MAAELAKAPNTYKEACLLTPADVLKLMKISMATLDRLVSSKKDPLPSVRFRKTRRFQLEKVLWWIENHQK